MLIVSPSIFVADTKLVDGYNFVAPLRNLLHPWYLGLTETSNLKDYHTFGIQFISDAVTLASWYEELKP